MKYDEGAFRSVLFEGAWRNVLFVVLDVLGVIVGVPDRELVVDCVDGGEAVDVGRAARSRGLLVGVEVLTFFVAVVADAAGEWRALPGVVSTRGLRGGMVDAGGVEESWGRTVRRGGGVAFEFEMFAARRGFSGAGVRPFGRSLIVDIDGHSCGGTYYMASWGSSVCMSMMLACHDQEDARVKRDV